MSTEPSKGTEAQPAPAEETPTVHEAERASGPTGAVEYGASLTDEEAVQRRNLELDIVVRGSNSRRNRRKAEEIERRVGVPVTEDQPHARAGRLALPHFHQTSRSPDGHSFYEGHGRKAKKRKS
jgi:hypothetical protein